MTHTTNRQKKGISTVLTTLIIVVASVVLGTAVTLFGTSLFQTGSQQQSMTVTNLHLWQGANITDAAAGTDPTVEGAIVVRNSGDKILAVDTIEVRGQVVPFSNWYASTIAQTTTAVQQKQLAYCELLTTATDFDDDNGDDIVSGAPNCATGSPSTDVTTALAKQTGPISLEPGKAVIIYFFMPGSNDAVLTNDIVSAADVGATTSVSVQAGQITQVQTISVAKNV